MSCIGKRGKQVSCNQISASRHTHRGEKNTVLEARTPRNADSEHYKKETTRRVARGPLATARSQQSYICI